MFQYISCCYLLINGVASLPSQMGFNTSHVVIYYRSPPVKLSSLNCFNTSHVVIYFRCKTPEIYRLRVSIHLMLLFIELQSSSNYKELSFNTSHVVIYYLYILYFPFYSIVSIHLMLLFIWCTEKEPGQSVSVSIHLMLLFIQRF